MAAHNSARYIQRALASIDSALKGRPYVLVMADDASTDNTVSIARQFPMRAQERVIVTLPKAPCVGESKNRAVKLAAPFLQKYPWVAFMDDDDMMLPGRFDTLLESLEAEGQKAGVGDWVHHPEGGHPTTFTGDRAIHGKIFAPGTTLVHRDCIPKTGDYFVPVPRDVFEDMTTHHRFSLTGVPWCYHGGDPVHKYCQRNDSLSRGPEHSTRMLQNTIEHLRKQYPQTRTSIASFCTVAIGPSLEEAEILVRSLRITGNVQPVVVLTDSDGERVVKGWAIEGVETVVRDSEAYAKHFVDFNKLQPWLPLNPGPFLGKMDVITEAARRHGTTLFLDADVVVLRRFMDVIDAPIGLAPELSRTCKGGASNWEIEKFGYFNGGYVYATKDATHIMDWWRREFLKSWRWFGSDNRSHGGFTDQSSLDLIPLFGQTHIFHPGHDFMYTRVPRDITSLETVDEVFEKVKIRSGFGLFHRGWPIVTLHAHFRTTVPGWFEAGRYALRKAVQFSQDPNHAEIYALIAERP